MAKVLLADDSVTIQKVVEIVLKEKGFEVRAVNTGEDALIALDSYTPDIVLADIQMPGISGYQLTEQIRQHPQTRDLPVILLAGAFEPLDLPLAQKVGANRHLIKPFESKDLVNMINELLSAKKTAPARPALPPKADTEELLDIDFSDIMSDLNTPEVEAVAEADEEAIEVMAFEDEADETAVMASDILEDIAEPTPVIETFTPAPAPPAAPAAPASLDAQATALPHLDMEGILRSAIEQKLGALDLASALSRAVEGSLAGIIGPDEVRSAIREAITPSINDSIEKILWEIMPDMIEAMLRDAIKETVVSLKQELENVVWDTVPEIAENIIRQEINSIRSGN